MVLVQKNFLKIIKYVIQDANVFVISHKTGMDERFEDVIKFEKVKGLLRYGKINIIRRIGQ